MIVPSGTKNKRLLLPVSNRKRISLPGAIARKMLPFTLDVAVALEKSKVTTSPSSMVYLSIQIFCFVVIFSMYVSLAVDVAVTVNVGYALPGLLIVVLPEYIPVPAVSKPR